MPLPILPSSPACYSSSLPPGVREHLFEPRTIRNAVGPSVSTAPEFEVSLPGALRAIRAHSFQVLHHQIEQASLHASWAVTICASDLGVPPPWRPIRSSQSSLLQLFTPSLLIRVPGWTLAVSRYLWSCYRLLGVPAHKFYFEATEAGLGQELRRQKGEKLQAR